MKKCLFIYTSDLEKTSGGTKRTITAKNILSKYFDVDCFFTYKNPKKIFILLNAIFLNYLKTNFFSYFKIKKYIKKNKYKFIFFDDSNNGKIVKKIKQIYPEICCIVNFHNNEQKYYYDMYKRRNVLFYPLYIASKINQIYSSTFGDKLVFITERDKKEVSNGKQSYVIPATLKDTFSEVKESNFLGDYFLFFGSSFYANNEAVEFIINKIAPFVEEKIIIAGSGMDITFKNTKVPKNVTILGFIDNVQKLFNNAKAFLCPIFSGSGMKIKLVEALMYGKTIICSEFAAIGFEKKEKVFIIANTPQEYISCIRNYNEPSFNTNSRLLYLEQYDENLNDKYYYPVFF